MSKTYKARRLSPKALGCETDRLIDHGWKSNEFRNSACMRISDDEMRVFKRACLPKRSSKHAQEMRMSPTLTP
jgi:hypothetical protein